MVVARGLESLLADASEFEVGGILHDLSRSSETHLRNIDADIILVDPSVFDSEGSLQARKRISEFTEASVVAIQTSLVSEDVIRQYDEAVSIYDDPSTIIKKLRAALDARADAPKAEGEDLSQREKEILVCVAKGMLNKEIADLYNISIYTVITHRKNITRKTGIKTVAGLTVYALLNGLIDMNSIEQ